ncbi:E2 [Procyon lotor papillomavirus 1]|uniref:Regulatory protein E2 n=1 Tax=Procyon lotor papillomavirus 1 TaxID=312349 RepID=Q4QW01_9PAPI|nr:E2 [Procyon lotor papillomavirus 1]AAW88324.1 E2 [Procyon lotor papillomavirus 1]
MEALRQALDSVQEELLNLYEKDSSDLTDQVTHWNLMRREQVILHYARKNAITRVGMTFVPPQNVSQQKAKEAIEQELYLQSLLGSDYSNERWTLSDTSREVLLAPPMYCFKKGGRPVDVRFDGDPENVTQYTLWGHIYYQNAEDVWQKTKGHVDDTGLYYTAEGERVYYVVFKDEAKRYGTSGKYEVLHELTQPVSTSTSPRPTGSTGNSTSLGPQPRTSTPRKKITDRRRRRRVASLSKPTTVSTRGEQAPAPGLVAPTPEEVGRSHRSLGRRPGTRLERLVLEARDPPVVVFKGEPNSLKCLRFRLRKGYFHLFQKVSTTWSWTAGQGERQGRARMLMSFDSSEQRESFLRQAPIPRSVQCFLGSLDDL